MVSKYVEKMRNLDTDFCKNVTRFNFRVPIFEIFLLGGIPQDPPPMFCMLTVLMPTHLSQCYRLEILANITGFFYFKSIIHFIPCVIVREWLICLSTSTV